MYLSSKIKNLYILPEPVNHRITEKILCSLFLLFPVRFIKLGIMSSCSSNHMEEDGWLMKIETKREEPKDAIKGDKGKEATVDPSPVATQALLAEEEEEEGILKPYLTHLTPVEIEAFRVIEIVCIQNKYLTRENILHQEHITYLRSIIRRLENLLILKDRIASPPPPSSSPSKEHSPWLPPSLGEMPRYCIIPTIFCLYLF